MTHYHSKPKMMKKKIITSIFKNKHTQTKKIDKNGKNTSSIIFETLVTDIHNFFLEVYNKRNCVCSSRYCKGTVQKSTEISAVFINIL